MRGGGATALVARDAELARALRAVTRDRGVLVVGAAGAGRTAFAAAIAGELAAAPVEWLVATDATRLTPFGALASLLPPESAGVHPAVVTGLVRRALRERPGTLLVVDDAQHLDAGSAAVLLALAVGRDARLVVTMRAGATASDAVVALWKDGLLDRVDLAPLDRDAARALVLARLTAGPDRPGTDQGGPARAGGGTGRGGGDAGGGSPVLAEGAVELLWRASRGNPLYLTELVRYGVDTGRLRPEGGVWWWDGDAGAVPPRLGELLRRRLDDLSPAAVDAVRALAMGEPLPYETLTAVSSDAGVLELDDRELLAADDRDGVLRLRFAHPLLHAAAAGRLTPA
ncbi:MAG TPA: AAA family ATPase, partial [Pseudonocardiaceae bacterium]